MNETPTPTPEEWATKLEQILIFVMYALEVVGVVVIVLVFVLLVRSIPKHPAPRKQVRR